MLKKSHLLTGSEVQTWHGERRLDIINWDYNENELARENFHYHELESAILQILHYCSLQRVNDQSEAGNHLTQSLSTNQRPVLYRLLGWRVPAF